MLEIHFKGAIDRHSTNIVRVGDPIKFTWKSEHKSATFVGFVHTIEKNNTLNNVFTKIVCVNNSNVLKDTKKKIYKNLSADRIIMEIAKENGMHSDTSQHPLVIPNLVQAGQSDLQFMRHLAQKTGYVLRVSNTTIEFKPTEQYIYEHMHNAPVFYHFDVAPRALVAQQTLLSFTALDSLATPEYGSQGDIGMIMHDKNGNVHRFDKNHRLDQGSPKSVTSLPSYNWNNTYGQE